ncbi:MAG TPA: rod shape-determining protein MreD [Bacteroidales bacterium]|nr:rod shape-determining protein MreD [Bacteroidales bacterium]
MTDLLKNILRFAGLVLLQVWVLNNMRIGSYVNPFIYPLFIMMLPAGIPGWALLLLGFFTGTVIDLFMSTLGLHAAATVFAAFARPTLLNMAAGTIEPDLQLTPSAHSLGIRAWTGYVFTMLLMHHSALFILESFSFSGLFYTLLRIILSLIFSGLVIMMLSLFFSPARQK